MSGYCYGGPEPTENCPFCGGKASFKPRSFEASCDRCGAYVPVGASDSSEAITAWNTRVDLADAIVRAALERAAELIAPHPNRDKSDYTPLAWDRDRQACRILILASDPAEVAAIISAASQLNKAGDGNKERSDEEDRG